MVLSLILGLLMETVSSSSSDLHGDEEEQHQRVCPVCNNLHSSIIPTILCAKCITIMQQEWDGHRRESNDDEQMEHISLSTVMIIVSIALIAFFFWADVLRDCWRWAIESLTSVSTKDDK
ncbi:hypothetical protein PRIPAC_94674 [Pristionchus pacificus]|uniref:Uncharacterized protein n=1 Tax=Pristionchus pacificus TaxID=54126 RepID=A0A2A6BQI0_PRIPA|nr:hypothetical protein PRIPAC_94674 [Pristionchus pacificus]|eukprot:PDM68170.1 hypothetical protein PRIPAC_46214 [Pristionchus pacificus]